MSPVPTQRYFAEISYKGTLYHGWQAQPNAITVQGILQEALLRRFQQVIPLVGSGRTDTGVHASAQMAHLDLPTALEPGVLRGQLNAILPHDITIRRFYPVAPNAHARYDALDRTYYYYLSPRPNPFALDVSLYYPHPICLERLNQAASLLIGPHDFQSFCKTAAPLPHYRCTVTQAAWTYTPPFYRFSITANRFLYSMVRTVVGTLLYLDRHRQPVDIVSAILSKKKRSAAGQNAPPHGLFLQRVRYPNYLFLQA